MYKKAWCTCKVVVLLIKPIVFLTFSLPSASLDLKVPNKFLSVGPFSLGFGPASVGLSIVSQLMAISSYRRKRSLYLFLYRLH